MSHTPTWARSRILQGSFFSLLAIFGSSHAQAGFDCASIIAALAGSAAGVQCFVSTNLTTANSATTPSQAALGLASLPNGAWMVVVPTFGMPAPLIKQTPGIQVMGYSADSILPNQARWVIRLPRPDTNTRSTWTLVLGSTGGNVNEYGFDKPISDKVMQQEGFIYVGTNKGFFNTYPTAPNDPLGCSSTRDYRVDYPGDPIEEQVRQISKAAAIAKLAAAAAYGVGPARTYLFGTSNGAFLGRRVMESMPQEFDGAVIAEVALRVDADPAGQSTLNTRIKAGVWMPQYIASGFSSSSPSYQAILALGFSDDFFSAGGSYWVRSVPTSACRDIRLLDPGFGGTIADQSNYDFTARRLQDPLVAQRAIAYISTGMITRPMLMINGTLDNNSTLRETAEAYAQQVADSGNAHLFRLYEVQNAPHADGNNSIYPQLNSWYPTAWKALDAMVDWVENDQAPPPTQCVPIGKSLSSAPTDGRPEHCKFFLGVQPTIGILAPNAGTWVKGNITVAASGATASTTSTFKSIECLAGNQSLGAQESPSYAALFDTTSVPDGSLTLQCTAEDKEANAKTISTSVNVDNTPPELAIEAPAADGAACGVSLSFAISANASDAHLVSLSCSAGDTLLGTSNTGSLQTAFAPPATAGQFTITCVATDLAGNSRTESRTLSVNNQSVADKLQYLKSLVFTLPLNSGQRNSLSVKLGHALSSWTSSDLSSSCDQLQSFLNELNALSGAGAQEISDLAVCTRASEGC